jgi:hypothetical protein
VHRDSRTLALAALFLGLIIPAPTHAATLTWSAPPACPGSEEVRERITRGLGADLASLPEFGFEARVSRTDRGYELKLTVRKDDAKRERRIRAKTCPELVDALEAAVALALQSLSPTESESAPTTPASEPVEAAPEPEPAPAEKPEPPEPQVAANPPARQGSALYPSVSVGGVLDVGAFPRPAFGVEGSLGLGVGWFKAQGYGLLIPAQRSAVRGTAELELSLLAGGARLCGASRDKWWELRGCLAGEVGWLEGVGVNVDNPRRNGATWVAVAPEVVALARPPRQGWGGFLSLGAVFPLNREAFVLQRDGLVLHRPAAAALRAGLGIELEFR